MNINPHTHSTQHGLIDFGAGLILIVATVVVAAFLGGVTAIKDGLPPASAPDGWSMMEK